MPQRRTRERDERGGERGRTFELSKEVIATIINAKKQRMCRFVTSYKAIYACTHTYEICVRERAETQTEIDRETGLDINIEDAWHCMD